MSDYIDLAVVARVIGIGLLLGAGLPLVFATGLRALSSGSQADGGTTTFQLTKNPAAQVAGAVCFLVVAAAIVFGIYIIIHKS